MQPLNFIFAGAGEFGLPTLKAMLEAGHRAVGVYSQPDRPAGRGRKLTPTPIAQFALDHGLPVVRTETFNAESLPPADVMVVIAFGQKISAAHASHARLGAINLHASRLPRWRGAAPINWAILAGDVQTGNSIIRLAERMDAGAVLGMSSTPIDAMETAGELHDRLAIDGAPLMLRVIDELARGVAVEAPQDEALATRASKLGRESTKLEWAQGAESLARQIRGMFPWPGCRVRVIEEASGRETSRVTLVRTRAMERGGGTPGGVGADHRIGTGAGALEVVEIQPESKRPMTLEAYMNGHAWGAGLRLESIV